MNNQRQSIKKIAHIGIAVKQLDTALPFYTDALGLTVENIETVASEKVKIAFLIIGDTRIELLEPIDDTSPIHTFIQKRGEGIHHIALEVDDIEQRLHTLKQKGIQLIDETPKVGANETAVAFLHPKATFGVLYELCEKKGEDNIKNEHI